ncbi:hypothetical protein OSB04_018457 [Centaurea solstitialis]|uniref:Equilibrative nucleoside transporter n=1 Tax=Centaurea solstitialis TaxID=347529 RepID=A0AA38TMZ8_9ASTR|nr:hypothetical protein OSB04_018457 [Centaurea solstitialis]
MGGATTSDHHEPPLHHHLLPKPTTKTPRDSYNLAYTIHFILGTSYLIPWNAFVTAVDYFSYLYPAASVDRVFAVVYMTIGLVALLFVVFYSHRSRSFVRINVGLGLFVVALLVVPVMDVAYVKGRVGVYGGFYVSVAAVAVAGVGDALVQGGMIGTAGVMPERYMQAVVAGTAASGVLISFLRIFTKAAYPQDAHGIRKSAILYFIISIVVIFICIILHNVAHRLPVVKHYHDLKIKAMNNEKEEKGEDPGALLRSTLRDVIGTIKWYGLGIVILYVVTLSIFPGYITEDVHSEVLKDWYPIILLTTYHVFDLIGKYLTSIYVIEDSKVAIGASFGRLLFFPVCFVCLHGPMVLRAEIPVGVMTSLLGLTNGYFASCLLMLGPKMVPVQHAEMAGTVLVLFLEVGLACGSVGRSTHDQQVEFAPFIGHRLNNFLDNKISLELGGDVRHGQGPTGFITGKVNEN